VCSVEPPLFRSGIKPVTPPLNTALGIVAVRCEKRVRTCTYALYKATTDTGIDTEGSSYMAVKDSCSPAEETLP